MYKSMIFGAQTFERVEHPDGEHIDLHRARAVLKNNAVIVVFETGDGRIWCACYNGHPIDDSFEGSQQDVAMKILEWTSVATA